MTGRELLMKRINDTLNNMSNEELAEWYKTSICDNNCEYEDCLFKKECDNKYDVDNLEELLEAGNDDSISLVDIITECLTIEMSE